MGKTEKRFNKWLIGLVIGGAVVGGLSTTKKGKSISKRFLRACRRPFTFLKGGFREMRKTVVEQNNKK